MYVLLFILALQEPGKTVFVDRIAVKVNDKIVTERELSQTYKQQRAQVMSKYTGADLDQKLKELWKTTIESAEESLLLFEKATELGIALSEDDARGRLMAIKESNGFNDEEFEEALAQQTGMTLDEYVDLRRREDSAQVVIQSQIVSKIRVEESEVSKYFDEHIDEFMNPETYRIAEIVFLKGDDNAQTILTRAQACKAFLDKGGDFTEATKQYSDSTSKENGGDLGTVEFGTFRKEIEDKVRELEPGQTSEVFETSAAFFIIKLLEQTPKKPKPIDEVKSEIQQRLRLPRMEVKLDELIKDLRKRYLVKTYLPEPPWYLEL